ncbi:MAG: tetratricopeptide repeat protein [Bacteroidetes bacterium]|nr:tetratricopeptide repeat protein [Bacteroidota bacterium]
MHFILLKTRSCRKIIFACIALGFGFNSLADNGHKIDSLYTIIKTTKSDTVKINAQLKIANMLMQEDTVKGMHEIKKVIYALNSVSTKTFILRSYEKIGRICYANGLVQKARYYWNNGLASAKKEKNIEYQAKFYCKIADLLQSEDFSKQCIVYFDSALTTAKNGDEKLLSDILMKKGRGHYDIGDYKVAMDHYIQAQRLFEKNKWQNTEYGHLLHFIGSTFKQQDFYDKALEYYEEELKLARNIKNKALEAEALYLCAGMYGTKGDLDKELEYLNKAIAIFKEQNNFRMLGLMYSNLSANYSDKKDYKNAIATCERALEIFKETGEDESSAATLRNLGDLYSKTGNPKKALEYFKKAMAAALQVETKQLLNKSEITQSMAFAYSDLGDYKSAFNLLLEHRALNDSLSNASNVEYLHSLEKQYDTEKKEKEIALQKVEIDKSNAVVKQHKTQRNALIGGCILVLLVAGISIVAFINKRKTSRILSKQVNEINYQNAVIKEKNKDITDSIQYAKRLQEAVFPEADILNTFFAESFVLFRPKDIVSGDFYWFEEIGSQTIIIVGDCTGHGVPGAFMSILGHNLLNQIILEDKITSPGKILNLLDKRVSNALNKRESKAEYNDGMDMVICTIDKTKGTLSYAGANRPLVIRRDKELIELKPNKHAIGGIQDSTCKLFTQQDIAIKEADVLYMFSDGYYDQFGGPKGKKFKYKQLTGHIIEMASKPLEEQKRILAETLTSWQGNLEQVDDVCVVGIKI